MLPGCALVAPVLRIPTHAAATQQPRTSQHSAPATRVLRHTGQLNRWLHTLQPLHALPPNLPSHLPTPAPEPPIGV